MVSKSMSARRSGDQGAHAAAFSAFFGPSIIEEPDYHKTATVGAEVPNTLAGLPAGLIPRSDRHGQRRQSLE